MEHAVYPEAHLDVVFLRADVNVRGPFTNRLGDNGVDQPNDRCLLHHVLEGPDFNIVAHPLLVRLIGPFKTHFVHIFENAPDSRVGSVDAPHELIELLVGADHRLHFNVQQHFDGIQGKDIRWIRHGHGQQVAGFLQGHHLVFLGQVQGQGLCQVHADGILIRMVGFEFELLGNQLDDLGPTNDPFADQVLAKLDFCPFMGSHRLEQLILGDQAPFNEHLAQFFLDSQRYPSSIGNGNLCPVDVVTAKAILRYQCRKFTLHWDGAVPGPL